ncbi:peptidoglycan DD-metalloendopeptidase family protein [Corynebacterium vitaeruminis]|uniref:M23 peptidase domain-containing protein n=1 Tax=Corynebacterium vitaeruminis DSM 20294 TaxID=1224164 RepID=W5XYH6_9CORY|nr:peptidoglycan DD-metalloendopeptidase family protein [Corynebacterium vitaeruminis]AHI22061.1 M23 peptidase domain-containing protein [Corynebacterium vitaeruminis DSM 20294]
MKRLGCGVLVILLFLVILVVVILGGDNDDNLCLDGRSSSSSSQDGRVPAGSFSLPERGATEHETSGFGQRGGSMHEGIDIAQGEGTPIYAYADGVVSLSAADPGGYGHYIIIDHEADGQTFSTLYGHMFDDHVYVNVGDKVYAGQHIADEGYNGGVSPPGPGGSHLHFEVHVPGYRNPVDPQAWLDKAVEPGTQADTKTDSTTPQKSTPATGSTQLQPVSYFSETNMQVNAVRGGRAVAANFPQITLIGGWRPSDAVADDHPQGRAIDVMIDNYQTSEGIALGDSIVSYFLAHYDEMDVDYIIWRQQLIYPGQTSQMEDRGGVTANHYDHVHVSFNPSDKATPGQDIGSAPLGGSATKADVSGTTSTDCVVNTGLEDTALNAENIPADWVRPIQIAGGTCDAVNAPLIAALLEQESGFQTGAASGAGAQGPAQFMPATWATIGAEMSEDGEVIGPPGSGDITDPKDAIPAAGRYLCQIAANQAPLIASGAIKGDRVQLMLAGYNAGEGAVQQYGGVPPYAETQNYVTSIPSKMPKYQKL